MSGQENHRWGIILAGGEGMRVRDFLLTKFGYHRPKQYCTIVGTRSMLRQTIDRAGQMIDTDRLLTIVTRHHLDHGYED